MMLVTMLMMTPPDAAAMQTAAVATATPATLLHASPALCTVTANCDGHTANLEVAGFWFIIMLALELLKAWRGANRATPAAASASDASPPASEEPATADPSQSDITAKETSDLYLQSLDIHAKMQAMLADTSKAYEQLRKADEED